MAAPPEVKGSSLISMKIEKLEWRRVDGPIGFDIFVEQFSSVFRINGYPWRLRVVGNTFNGMRTLYLICDKSSEAELWKCTATISDPVSTHFEFTHTFTSWNTGSQKVCICRSTDLTDDSTLYIGLKFEEKWKIWSTIPTIGSLDNPDGILVIGDEKKQIHVNKESLASQSPFFDRLFFGDFKEQNMNEITIRDVEYEDFSNLIKLLYRLEGASLTDENAVLVLGMADRFEIQFVKEKVLFYLLSSSSLSIQKKIIIADEYNLPFLMENLEPIWAVRATLKTLTKMQFEQMSKASLRVLFKTYCTSFDKNVWGLRMADHAKKETISISMNVAIWKSNRMEQFSPVRRINGYSWRLRLCKKPSIAALSLSLICDKSIPSELWQCTATITSRRFTSCNKFTHSFNSWDKNGQNFHICDTRVPNGYCLKVVITMDREDKRWRPCPTLGPSTSRNGIIVVGEENKKIEVNRESLASQSPHFKNLFFGETDEKNENEVAIRDVDYEEFANIIKLAYRIDGASLTEKNVLRVLELAQRFELKIVEDRVVSYLLSPSCCLSVPQKILIADRHGLCYIIGMIRTVWFGSLPVLELNTRLTELSQSPEFGQLSFETLRVLFKKFCSF